MIPSRVVHRGLVPLVLLLAACGTPRQPGAVTPAVGQPALSLSLPTAGGGRFSLEEARRDGPVVVVFYRGLF